MRGNGRIFKAYVGSPGSQLPRGKLQAPVAVQIGETYRLRFVPRQSAVPHQRPLIDVAGICLEGVPRLVTRVVLGQTEEKRRITRTAP
jgi:hypothetical protein